MVSVIREKKIEIGFLELSQCIKLKWIINIRSKIMIAQYRIKDYQ